MPGKIKYTLVLFFIAAVSIAQTVSPKPKPKRHSKPDFGIGAGMAKSVLFLTRNTKQDNEATGYSFSMVYGGSKITRGSLEATFYRPINIAPTWLDIHAYTIEANIHYLARMPNKKAFFYPLFGISYNVFQGFFTGINDYEYLSYAPGTLVTTRWAGVNVGTGFEYFFRPVSVFADYKMRVGLSDGRKELNIIDVCLSAGLRYNFRVRPIQSLFRNTRSRYLLDTYDEE